MKIDIKTNHLLITTSLNSDSMKQLLENPIVAKTGIGNIKYGWATIVLYTWLSHLATLQSRLLLDIDKEQDTFEHKADNLLNYAMQSVVYHDVETPLLIGGNIVVRKGQKFTKKAMRSALKLSLGIHPIFNELEDAYMLASPKVDVGINKLCSKDITKLISAIDFDIPSLSFMLKTLGYNYLVVQPYIQNDIIISSCQDKPEYLCILYGPRLTKYKRVLPEQLASLAATNSLNLPMQRMEAMQYTPPILTNDYKI